MPETSFSPDIFLKDPGTLTKGEDPFQYDAFRKAVGDIATQTAKVNIPDVGGIWKAGKRATFPGSPERAQIQAAIDSFKTQGAATQQEASKAAQALAMQGASTEASMRRLQELSQEAYGRHATATETWGAAAKKAGDYVQSAELRTQQALNRLDEINAGISEGRDFAKAHAMNAAVQGMTGAMKAEEDQIIQKYGIGSKEHEQFQARKMQTLATAQSQIEASYRQLAEQQNLTYMNASNELQWKEDMYKSFQEQQHVETLRYLAHANDAYDMQLSQFQLTVEQLRSAGMENLANWIVQTPVFSVDILPLATFVADVAATYRAQVQAAGGGNQRGGQSRSGGQNSSSRVIEMGPFRGMTQEQASTQGVYDPTYGQLYPGGSYGYYGGGGGGGDGGATGSGGNLPVSVQPSLGGDRIALQPGETFYRAGTGASTTG